MNNDPRYVQPGYSGRDAKAEAKAAKARAKAMRPFYAKKRFIIPAALVALIVVVALASGGGGEGNDSQPVAADDTSTTAADGPNTASSNTEFPPADDVAITECTTQEALGWPVAKLTITNNSPKSSTYMVSVNFVNTAGQKIGEGMISSSNVAPGQQALVEASGTGEPEPGFTCEIAQVERFAA